MKLQTALYYLQVNALSIVIIVALLVGFGLIWLRLTRAESKLANLINSLGSQVGEYVDAMEDSRDKE